MLEAANGLVATKATRTSDKEPRRLQRDGVEYRVVGGGDSAAMVGLGGRWQSHEHTSNLIRGRGISTKDQGGSARDRPTGVPEQIPGPYR